MLLYPGGANVVSDFVAYSVDHNKNLMSPLIQIHSHAPMLGIPILATPPIITVGSK